jgi:hypothetical protein
MENVIEYFTTLGIFDTYIRFQVFFLILISLLLRRRLYHSVLLRNENNRLQHFKLDDNDDSKRDQVEEFINKFPKKSNFYKITREWENLQKSLSNFQKYDFDLHIDSYLRKFKVDYPGYARNLLLIGLLFTFVGLSLAFSGIEKFDPNTLAEIMPRLIGNISLAFTSTIAALISSLFVIFIGNYVNRQVGTFHANMVQFLILYVHPHFSKGGEDIYFKRLEYLLDSMGNTVRDVNDNLATVNRLSIETLRNISNSVDLFSTSFSEYSQVLANTQKAIERMHEHGSDTRTTVQKLHEVINGMVDILGAENSVLREVVESSRLQSQNIEALTQKSSALTEASAILAQNVSSATEKISDSIEVIRIVGEQTNDRIEHNNREFIDNLKLTLATELGENTRGISEAILEVKRSLMQLPEELRTDLVSVTTKTLDTAAILNNEIRTVTEKYNSTFESSKDTLNAIALGYESLIKSSLEVSQTISNRVEENQKETSKLALDLLNDHKLALASLSSGNQREYEAAWNSFRELVEKQKSLLEQLNKAVVDKAEAFDNTISTYQNRIEKGMIQIIQRQEVVKNRLGTYGNRSSGSLWSRIKGKFGRQ